MWWEVNRQATVGKGTQLVYAVAVASVVVASVVVASVVVASVVVASVVVASRRSDLEARGTVLPIV
ncbi:hypothetical protein SV7mr_17230 [Stieleria bergensis]|uniref:Uncharacterized protein n=1 Tax=Stieleria bergensis TaxID=2528025 RepID=A0A517SSW7_9BACT|nr:hypothetical protein SV7mr_17230 [Planctomycetes bacterium SV_7m_r]